MITEIFTFARFKFLSFLQCNYNYNYYLIIYRESTSSKDTVTTQQSVFHDMSDSSLDEDSEDEEQDTIPLAPPPTITVNQDQPVSITVIEV